MLTCVAVTGLSLFLNLYGIRRALPSSERIELLFGSSENLENSLPDLNALFKRGESFDQFVEPTPELELLSPYLDLIRTYHSDEAYFLKYIANLDPARFDFDPKIYKYGSLQVYLVALLLKIGETPGWVEVTKDINFYVLHPESFAKFYLVARLASAFMGALAVFFVTLASWKMFGRWVGLLSGLALAVMPLFALSAHFGKVDVPSTFWVALSIYFVALLLERWTWKRLLLASVAAGLAFSTKYPAGIALVAVWMGVLVAHREVPPDRIGVRKFKELLISFSTFLIVFFLTSPFVFIRLGESLSAVAGEVMTQYGRPEGVSAFSFGEFLRVGRTFVSTHKNQAASLGLTSGWGLFFASLAGVLLALFRRARADFVLLIPAALFFAVVGAGKLPYPEYMLPLLPFLAVLFGRGAATITVLFRRFRLGVLPAIVTALLLTYSLLFTFAYDRVMAHRDVRREASIWISGNLIPGSAIGMFKYPVIYRMPFIRQGRFVIVPVDRMTVWPRYFILTSDEYRSDVRDIMFFVGSYRLLKKFPSDVRFLGIRFPSLCDRIGSGLGQISPWIEIYER